FLAERSRTSKLPNPINWTFSPFLSDSMTDSKTASTALAASFLDSSLFSATALIKSVLFMTFTSSQKFHLVRSEEHTSELQSRFDLVCRLLLEKKKISDMTTINY